MPKKVSATKQKILDIAEDIDDDEIVVRLEKGSKGVRKYEFFKVPFHSFKPSRENCAYHEIITQTTIRLFFDIDHSTSELFHRFLTSLQDVVQSAFGFMV